MKIESDLYGDIQSLVEILSRLILLFWYLIEIYYQLILFAWLKIQRAREVVYYLSTINKYMRSS